MNAILLEGMQGLGDNLHQRAVVRYFLKMYQTVWLRTPWPAVYHDMTLEGRLQLLRPDNIVLRTQAKNAQREARSFSSARVPNNIRHIRVSYSPQSVRNCGSVLGAMLSECGVPAGNADFTLPVLPSWHNFPALKEIPKGKPILVYRPLVDRTEWRGCNARNPDAYAYGTLAETLRSRFTVVSLADFEPEREWLSGADIDADVKFHKGELPFTAVAALVSQAALSFGSPGFLIPLSQAVHTPSVCVFGGYENGKSFALGAQMSPHLAIDTMKPCDCFQHDHGCDKRIDLKAAKRALADFVKQHVPADDVQGPNDVLNHLVSLSEPKGQFQNPLASLGGRA